MKRKIRVYLDTSAISAYFDKRNPERQFLTGLFFKRVDKFDAYISDVVLAEIGGTRGTQLRNKLRNLAVSFKTLSIDEESRTLADKYVEHEAIPPDYSEDALHIAISTINEIDYLLSWNFEHIDNQLLQEIHPHKFLEHLGIHSICINNGLGKEQKDQFQNHRFHI